MKFIFLKYNAIFLLLFFSRSFSTSSYLYIYLYWIHNNFSISTFFCMKILLSLDKKNSSLTCQYLFGYDNLNSSHECFQCGNFHSRMKKLMTEGLREK